jgi:hypothetical protein
MSDIDILAQIITRSHIIVNAQILGWKVIDNGNEITLIKKTDTMTDNDRNIFTLINNLVKDNYH